MSSSVLTNVRTAKGWQFVRFDRVVRRVQDSGREDLQFLSVFLDQGVVPRDSRDDNFNRLGADTSNYLVVQPGDIVFNKLRTWQGGIGMSKYEGRVSPAYFVCRPSAEVEPRFLHYLLRSSVYLQELTRISKQMPPAQFDIGWEQLRLLPTLLPPVGVQRAIADLLDRETARIDALIDGKNRLAGLVRERLGNERERVILGLDLRSEPSSSGFFVSRPVGWAETTIRHLGCDVQTGPFGSQLHSEEYVPDGYPVVNPANLRDGSIVPIEGMTVSEEKRQELARHILRKGDIVFGRRGEMGRAGLVTEMEEGWLCGTGSLRLRLTRSQLLPQFLKVLLETRALRRYFELQAIGSTMDNLNSEIVLGLPSLVPPTEEQGKIVEEIRQVQHFAYRLMRRLHDQVVLLQEHRQVLITAAATGQLEIAEAA